ncbi:DUF1569 domain-containing protein [Streptomyces sp. NPDC047042]|uniref:DUF1569 domain-containing protein n=1 Tax=Streptomyces sp. NPDC047042 TaxID=3154807 RepID=UPI0033CB86B0
MTTPRLTELAERAQKHVADDLPESDVLAPGSVWNLSQTLQHCAQTVRYSVAGYPRLKPPLYRATVGALAKRAFLGRDRMRHPLGAVIDGAPQLDRDLPPAAAVAQLAEAVAQFTEHTGTHAPHPAYGPCTHDEFARLHAMHLAEHLPGLAHD